MVKLMETPSTYTVFLYRHIEDGCRLISSGRLSTGGPATFRSDPVSPAKSFQSGAAVIHQKNLSIDIDF